MKSMTRDAKCHRGTSSVLRKVHIKWFANGISNAGKGRYVNTPGLPRQNKKKKQPAEKKMSKLIGDYGKLKFPFLLSLRLINRSPALLVNPIMILTIS